MSIVGAILAIGLLIVVHEAGHYFVAKWCNMRVDRFSIGFGPAILSWRRKGTDFTLGPIPFGGFVQINGMTVADEIDPNDPQQYPNRPVWQRFLTIFAGPATNYLAAAIIAFGLYTCAGVPTGTSWLKIAEVSDGYDAVGKLQPGDQIVKLDGEPLYLSYEGKVRKALSQIIEDSKGAPLVLTVVRDGQEVDVPLAPKPNASKPEQLKEADVEGWKQRGYFGVLIAEALDASIPDYLLGIVFSDRGVDERVDAGPIASLGHAAAYPVRQTKTITAGLYGVITGKLEGELHGPIGIGSAIKKTFEIGWIEVLELLMLLNVTLGLFNLLPLPALDGGRLVFLGYEMATRRRANPKVEATVHMVGIMALLVLMVLVTYKDIARLVSS